MSEFKVCFTTVLDVQPHTNAERLEIATVYGFNVVIRKGQYQAGDSLLYIPVDSILPLDFEEIIFPPDSKVKLDKGRVRQIRLRGYPSQGLAVTADDVKTLLRKRGLIDGINLRLETDYQELLGIKKYEPPVPDFQAPRTTKSRKKPLTNTNFHSYNGIDNIKWYPTLFDGEEVVIQEKLHGSNCRAAILPTQANTLLKRIKRFFGILPKYEYCYGSNNVELTNRSGYKGFYGDDVYGKVLKKVGAEGKLRDNETIYGELIGPGIQKNYDYGLKEHHFVLFDVKVHKEDGTYEWLSPEAVEAFAKEREFDLVPILYKGIWNRALAEQLVSGASIYCPEQKIREGVVVKSKDNYNDNRRSSNKKVLKMINPDYLDDKSNTDNH